jgi:hypothetical protein
MALKFGPYADKVVCIVCKCHHAAAHRHMLTIRLFVCLFVLSDVDSLLQAWDSRETRVKAAIVNARYRENMELGRICLDPSIKLDKQLAQPLRACIRHGNLHQIACFFHLSINYK